MRSFEKPKGSNPERESESFAVVSLANKKKATRECQF